ncbi:hypothetical protein MIMGU_mgv11b023535mg [Erythranthe guttata]|uniref:Uncharacterized protein n=1 Tax=Erythranthe guttata TaxID=4155 RepID=A0A022Q551_ERYGU|nr:hypothetical protein MIMGU_mgv11b023535mg [Erythranthe guttata]
MEMEKSIVGREHELHIIIPNWLKSRTNIFRNSKDYVKVDRIYTGDKKTAKGKRFNHSFGNARPKDKNKGRGPPRVPAPPLPPRKDKYDDGSVVKIEIDESFSN